MKKSIAFSLGLIFASVSISFAQDLDKILKMHYKAVGQKNILNVKSIKATGSATGMMGGSSSFEMMNKRPGKLFVIVNFQGSEIKQAYDGETAWMVNPMMGSSSAITVTGAEADGLKESADMDGQLWNYKEKGHKLELDGPGEVDGKKVYVLKLSKKIGITDYYYIDQESYLVNKLETKSMVNGSEVEVEVLLSNYNDVDGYMMPFKTVQIVGGQTVMTIELEEVVFNEKIDDAVFKKPG